MSNVIKEVKAFKYKGQLFESRKKVAEYIIIEKENRRFEKEIRDQEKLKTPLQFEIKNGYFDFLIYKDGISRTEDDDIKYVCYRTNNFKDAIEKVVKRKDVRSGSLDYECQILDKNKNGTGVYISLFDLPDNHEARKYF